MRCLGPGRLVTAHVRCARWEVVRVVRFVCLRRVRSVLLVFRVVRVPIRKMLMLRLTWLYSTV